MLNIEEQEPVVNEGATTRSKQAGGERSPAKAPAKRGGGPRTVKGKKISSRNAIKHGITSSSPVAGGESQEEFEAFLQGMRGYFLPDGVPEEAEVYTMTSLYWRRPRVEKREAHRIDARLAELESKAVEQWPTTVEERMLDELDCDLDEAVALLEGLERLDHSISINAKDVSNALFLPAVVCTRALPHWLIFPPPDGSWTPSDMERWICALAEHLRTSPSELTRTALSKGRGILENKQRRRTAHERLEREALFSSAADIELDLRFEVAYDRMIDRSLKRLELLQRVRGGETPPLPERIEVSVS